MESRGWGVRLARCHKVFTMSITVSIAQQKQATDSTHPIITDRWKAIRGSLLPRWSGIIKARAARSSMHSHMHMYAPNRSILDRRTGPRAGLAETMLYRRRWNALPNCIASDWACGVMLRFAPLQV
eukprot:4647976-Ditylum_brightwellii.AAC.2